MEHIWSIVNLTRTEPGGMVTEVEYKCVSKQEVPGLKHPCAHTSKGKLNLTTGSISDPNFIRYENLSESVVFGWLTSSIDTYGTEQSASGSIAKRIRLHYEEVPHSNHIKGLPW